MIVPVFIDLAAVGRLVEIAHQAGVIVLVLADEAEVRMGAGAEFPEQIA